MAAVRSLLSRGNGKLGESVHTWSLPVRDEVCVGSSSVCRRVCYATQSRFRFASVRARLEWNYAQSLRDDFPDRLAHEVRRRGCLVVRAHVSGDFYDAVYAAKWLTVMRRVPKARYYFYTRSWRQPGIAPVLEEMARLRQVRAWYSVDSETGLPERVPPGVRLAYLQARAGERPELVDLVFRVRRLRHFRAPLGVVCPSETPRGRSRDANCGNCGRCWQ